VNNSPYAVLLVHSTSHALRVEKLLRGAGITCKLIPVPRHLGSDCGVCLRIHASDAEAVRQIVEAAQVDIAGVHQI
jgi:hypothetical protein